MGDPADYREINLANWNSRVPHHEAGYGLDRFADPTYISDVVRFDLPRLGDVAGLRGVHLQCHIGSDTVSLARLGATMSGLDFSGPALDAGRRLAAASGVEIDFREADVYDAVEAFEHERFDFVFTGIGALCWLPDVARWAQVVAELLRPGGFLFIREGHPVLWALDDPRPDQLLVMQFPYFETDGNIFVSPFSYVAHDEELTHPTMVNFNHGMAEILNAIWDAGMDVTLFEEHRSVPWNGLGEMMEEIDGGEWVLRDGRNRLPLSYTLRAVRR